MFVVVVRSDSVPVEAHAVFVKDPSSLSFALIIKIPAIGHEASLKERGKSGVVVEHLLGRDFPVFTCVEQGETNGCVHGALSTLVFDEADAQLGHGFIGGE